MTRVLIVDDQKGVRRLLEELFKKEGWEVYIAADGKEAIDNIEYIAPDVVLMDMKMPKMNGLEAAQQILSKDISVPIVMMTAYGEMDVIKEAMEAGVRKCVTKPFDIIDLRDIIMTIIMDKVS